MDARTKGLVATIAAVVLCGCPGLFLCAFGAVSAAGIMPYTAEFNGISNSGTVSPTVGFALLCVALILIAIPVAVGFFTLRKRPAAPTTNEPMPPAA